MFTPEELAWMAHPAVTHEQKAAFIASKTATSAPPAPPAPAYPSAPAMPSASEPRARAADVGFGRIMAEAKDGNKLGLYLPPGRHVWDIVEAKLVPSKEGLYFVLLVRVVQSDSPDVVAGDIYEFVRGLQDSNDKFKYGRNDVKDLLSQWVEKYRPGVNPGLWREEWDSFTDEVTGPAQVMAGSRWSEHAFEVEKKQSPGEVFTKRHITIMDSGQTLALRSAPSASPPAPPSAPPAPALAAGLVPLPNWPAGLPYPPGFGPA